MYVCVYLSCRIRSSPSRMTLIAASCRSGLELGLVWGLEVIRGQVRVLGCYDRVRLKVRGHSWAVTCVLACCCCCWLMRVWRASTVSGQTRTSEESCFWSPSIHAESWRRRREEDQLLLIILPLTSGYKVCVNVYYLLCMRVERHSEIQQQLPLFNTLDKGLWYVKSVNHTFTAYKLQHSPAFSPPFNRHTCMRSSRSRAAW